MAIEVRVPDIGDYQDIPVIEILVKAGDHVAAEDALVTLESDKATMDVPSPQSGRIHSVQVKLGDKVSQGSVIVLLDSVEAQPPATQPENPSAGAAHTPGPAPVSAPPGQVAPASAGPSAAAASPSAPVASGSALHTITVPDIGDYADIPVIELLVKVGDSVSAEDALLTLESDKATMDVPSPVSGTVTRLLVKLGDTVSKGSPIAEIKVLSEAAPPAGAAGSALSNSPGAPAVSLAPVAAPAGPSAQASPAASVGTSTSGENTLDPAPAAAVASAAAAGAEIDFSQAHASPSVRRFARELGVNLNAVKGSGPKQRILEEDVKAHVKQALRSPTPTVAPAASAAMDLLPWPKIDFSKFGEVEVRPLSRIKKISGANLHRNWVRIPHVTNQDEADITGLEALRTELNAEFAKSGVKLTALAFLIKAVTVALRQFPDFNASLDGDDLVLKRYVNIGFAADTPNGLVVPVLKNADRKGVLEIARESSELAAKARDGKLAPGDMQGGCFSISSLGGIGGGYFTPIINAPEVAILGVGRSVMRPVWDGEVFQPRLMLPLSLSYDHRVIDGAAAARFNALLVKLLADMRRALL